MELALGHPEHGYYMNRDPFGASGDFTTAPEISQMFGELVGLWAAEVWTAMGSPSKIRLIELGPGRGTLMSDALRAGRIVPEFRAALERPVVEHEPSARRRFSTNALGRDDGAAVAWSLDLPLSPSAGGSADRHRQRVPGRAARAPICDARRPLANVWLVSTPAAISRSRLRARRRRRSRPPARKATFSRSTRRAISSSMNSATAWRGRAARLCSSTTVTPPPAFPTRCRRCNATGRSARSPTPVKPT